MGTRWESYSQLLLKQLVPEWKCLVVDGRKNWSPIGFISQVIDADADYIIHVDEDCFIESRSALLKLISFLDDNPQFVAAGIPDGGHYYRDHNPAALNLFFVVFRVGALRVAWKEKRRWEKLKFRDEFAEGVLCQCKMLDTSRIKWDEAESYYPLFWSLLGDGGKFLYLDPKLLTKRWSTQICLPSGEILAEHLWYLRQWFSEAIMQGHDCPNCARYEQFRVELMKKNGISLRFRLSLAYLHAKRFIRRILK